MKRSSPTIVVTRGEGPDGPLAAALARRGARVLHVPTIAIAPPSDWEPLDRALTEPGGYDWILFTSAHAVDAVCARPAWAAASGRRWRVAAAGAKTAGRLRALGVEVDLIPRVAGAAGLSTALVETDARERSSTARALAGARILWPRSEIASVDLADALRRAGAEVIDPVAYRTLAASSARPGIRDLTRRLEAGEIDGIAFMSPSSARGLAALLGSADLSMFAGRVAIGSIGPTTSAALASLGSPADVEASVRTADALAEALIRWLDTRQEVSR